MNDDDIRSRFRLSSRESQDYSVPVPPRPRPVAPPAPLPAQQQQPLRTIPAPPQPVPTRTSRPVQTRPQPVPAPMAPKAPDFTAPPATERKKSGSKKKVILLVTIIFVLLAGGAAAGYWFYYKPRHKHPAKAVEAASTVAPQSPAQTKQGENIRLFAVGDSIAYTSINDAAKKTDGSYDYLPLMSAMKPIFDKADIRFCDEATPAGGIGLGISGSPVFNAPLEFSKGLEAVGCNAIDLASPDTNDKGQPGIDTMLTSFDNQSNLLAVVGANRSADEQNTIRYFSVKGVKFAMLAYTTSSNKQGGTPFGVNSYSDQLADAQIKEAKTKANVIIIGMHWGTDYAPNQNADQDRIAQHLADQNADIILGSGPHVVEPVKVLNGQNGHQSIVWFSLGNFLNSQVPVETLVGGMAVMDINSATQELTNPRLMPVYMHYEWTAVQKQSQSAADLAARHNFQLLPLDQATDLLPKSQNNTTIQAQQDRIKAIVNKYFNIPLITSTDL